VDIHENLHLNDHADDSLIFLLKTMKKQALLDL